MTRQLSDSARAQCAAATTAPVNILKVSFGGQVGDRWYSDRDLGAGDGSSLLNAQGRVVDWGRISLVLAEQTAGAVGDCSLELADADGALRGYLRQLELQRRPVTIYQYFMGLGESDAAPVLVGMIDAPVRWNQARRTLRFDVTDISTFHRATAGNLAHRGTFPRVALADENSVLPLVFGRVRRARTVHARAGASALLVRACTATDTRLYVDDASLFPQGQSIRIRVDKELIEGRFQGNTFHVSARGLDLSTGRTTTRAAGVYQIEDSTLTGGENEYAPYFIRLRDPGGKVHHRPVWYYSAETHRLGYQPPIIYNNALWEVPAGYMYDLTTWARAHEAGTPVYLVEESYIYILNDAPSKRVHGLVGYGRIFDEKTFEDGQKNLLDIEGYVPIDSNHYTINLNDATSFPELGRAVTTATFKRNPKELYPRLRDDRLWADIEGVESAGDGTGTLLENPADVIRAILTRWLGLQESDLDVASFDEAARALAGFRMAFALTRQFDALHLCADLAFQSRCALLWEDGKARLRVLRNAIGEPAATIGQGQIAQESLQIERADLRGLASEVVARYGSGSEARSVVLRDAAVEAAFGRRTRTLELWAYEDRRMAASVARFWLERWKRLPEHVRLSTFLTSLALQRHDAVALDLDEYFAPGQKAQVQEIAHEPGSGRDRRIDTISMRLRLPIWAGCSTTCETECESSGESGCLLICEIEAESACWQCETQCEALCELACTTEAEIHCIVHDTDGGSLEGCGGCETSCESLCQAQCETHCESGCQSGCQVECETASESCASSCEVGCETGCQTRCELSCEATACETGCETSCQTSCEAASCESGCETTCQSGCEISCELACEATACETGCEVTCQTGCEMSCQTGCQTGCEVECETGAESCASSCEVGCETGCETDCQSGCESSGETGGCLNSVSDNFNRANEYPLQAPWVQMTANRSQLLDNQVWGLDNGGNYYRYQTPMCSHNHKAWMTLGLPNYVQTSAGGPALRVHPDDLDCYVAEGTHDRFFEWTILRLKMYYAGGWYQLAEWVASSYGVASFGGSLNGNAFKGYYNNTHVVTATDSTLNSETRTYVGFFETGPSGDYYMDDWGADLNV